MCGICGFVGIHDRSLLETMVETLSHRGPDARGIYHKNGIGLGHARLSVIDLSSLANQPMCNEDGRIWLIGNGEIYNYEDLINVLESKGHQFKSKSDMEVVIHAYEEYGQECVTQFNGAFAFCIWDEYKQYLLLARDRLGIRPLYYTRVGDEFLFASELKAILKYHRADKKLSYASFDRYLTFRHTSGTDTMFEKIFQLPPAHILSYHKSHLWIRRYWNIDLQKLEYKLDSDLTEHFFELFRDSVKLRMISDVPVGLFLSGGIDSSAIVGMLAQLGKLPLKTFSIGFDESNDEGDYAQRISQRFNTEHHHIESRPEDIELLPEIVSHLDGPIGDAIIIPMFILSRLCKEHVKVVLTGEGADELLGGYIHQKILKYTQLYRRIVPDFLTTKVVMPFVEHMPVKVLDAFFDYPAFLAKEGKVRLVSFLSCIRDFNRSYLSLSSLFSEEDKKNLLHPDLYQQLKRKREGKEYITGVNGETFFEQAIYYDMHSWLPGYTLFKQDRILMANSVEGRVPFLDHRLVEFAMRLPLCFKMRRMTDKYILRKSMQTMLSKEVAFRKKYPFFVAADKTYSEGFRRMVGDFLSEGAVKKRGYFNHGYINNLLKNCKRSSLLFGKQLMNLLILEVWCKKYIDSTG